MTAFQVGYNYQEYKTKRIMRNKISFKHSIEWRIVYTKARKKVSTVLIVDKLCIITTAETFKYF